MPKQQTIKINFLFSLTHISNERDEMIMIKYLGKPAAYIIDDTYELVSHIPKCFSKMFYELIDTIVVSTY